MNVKDKLIHAYNRVLGDPDRFVHVTLECSTACNRNCAWCTLSKKPRRPERILGNVRGIIDQLARAHYVGSICWSWMNEPTMNPLLWEQMRYAKRKLLFHRFQMLTNGDFLVDANGGIARWLEVASTIDISVHPNPACDWLSDLRRLPEKLRRRVYIVLCIPQSLQARCGVVESVKPTRTSCDMIQVATVSADGYMPICCNDYDYRRDEDTDVLTLGIFEAYRRAERIRRSLREWRDVPAICKTCTPGAALTIRAEDWLRVVGMYGRQLADWPRWVDLVRDGTIPWHRNMGSLHDAVPMEESR